MFPKIRSIGVTKYPRILQVVLFRRVRNEAPVAEQIPSLQSSVFSLHRVFLFLLLIALPSDADDRLERRERKTPPRVTRPDASQVETVEEGSFDFCTQVIVPDRGVFVAYPSPPNSGDASLHHGFLTFWVEAESGAILVFDEVLHDERGLGLSLLSLERDRGVPVEALVVESAVFDRVVSTSGPLPVGGPRWTPAAYESLWALMSYEWAPSDDAPEGVGSVALECNCLPMAMGEPGELDCRPVSPSPHGTMEAVVVALCCNGNNNPPPPPLPPPPCPPPCDDYCPVGDMDCDGTPDEVDPDLDGDGLPNEDDPDADGDGQAGADDGDDDGDGEDDWNDPEPEGCVGACCDDPCACVPLEDRDPCCGMNGTCCNVDCDDENECTNDICDAATGECAHYCQTGATAADCSFPFSAELISIQFMSGIGLYRDGSPEVWDNGKLFIQYPDQPHWKKTDNPDFPHAFVGGSKIRIRVKMRVSGGTTGSATLKVEGPDGITGEAPVSVTCGDKPVYVTFWTTTALPVEIKSHDPLALNWSIRPPGETSDSFLLTTYHTVYVTLGQPIEILPTLRRISTVCGWAAGKTSRGDAAMRIWENLSVSGQPPQFSLESPTTPPWYARNPWLLLKGGVGNTGDCRHLADLMRHACWVIGVPASIGYIYATRDAANFNTSESAWETTTFQLPSGGTRIEYLGFFAAGGYNLWQAVCVVNNHYYAPQTHHSPDALAFLKSIVCPNTLEASRYQCWGYPGSGGAGLCDPENPDVPVALPGGCP